MNDSITRLEAVKRRIAEAAARSGRKPEEITLVAVSKTQTIEHMADMADNGVMIFGENKIQEALPKLEYFKDRGGVSFHFIGRLQTNKVRQAVGAFPLIHSVDRLILAETINRIAKEHNLVQNALIQINLAGETQKGGIYKEELDKFMEDVHSMSNLRLRGFMFIPPFDVEPEVNRPLFAKMRQYFDTYKSYAPDMDVLSMGMSDDYAIAIEEGSTMVRIGTALFGAR